MPFTATVLRVMIASPSDVERERQIAQEVIHEVNSTHAEHQRVVLLPVTWETHAVPDMRERAQAVINREVLAACEILIGIFWTRLGTPTGVASSGTVEEITEHVGAGKHALL